MPTEATRSTKEGTYRAYQDLPFRVIFGVSKKHRAEVLVGNIGLSAPAELVSASTSQAATVDGAIFLHPGPIHWTASPGPAIARGALANTRLPVPSPILLMFVQTLLPTARTGRCQRADAGAVRAGGDTGRPRTRAEPGPAEGQAESKSAGQDMKKLRTIYKLYSSGSFTEKARAPPADPNDN